MDSEDGQVFVKSLAQFVRTHEKALANALQLRRQTPKNGQTSVATGETPPTHISSYQNSAPSSSTSNTLAAALSLGTLNFTSQSLKPAKLTLTSHHLFYLLSRIEEIGIPVGPMNVRLENIHAEASPANYVSFLSQSQRSQGRSDRDSIHSVSSVRSVMSGMSNLWSGFGLGSPTSAAKTEKAEAQLLIDLKYLYSAFTKIPCLRLSPNRKARLIGGYEEFPFDTAVPLLAFKNVSALEICDVDFRQFYGWDKLAEQLRSLTVKRSNVDDPTDLFVNIVLDDMDKRRRRSSRAQLPWPASPSLRFSDIGRANSTPSSPVIDDKLGESPKKNLHLHQDSDIPASQRQRPGTKSVSPSRPSTSRQVKVKRSGSGSSNSSTHSFGSFPIGILPASKWRFLRHLSLADNSLTSITSSSFAPLSNNLLSLDLSSNLIVEIPEALYILTSLRALNLSNCMIGSLHSLRRNPLPAITALNLRANRLVSIAGVERLLSLERLDLRDNRLQDPTELARLTGIPDIHEIWVSRNPFVKSHGNYRVQIFNLFRNTPGYSEDIMIDASAPGYGERRQLRDRVIEPEGTPIVQTIPLEPTSNLLAQTQQTHKINDGADGPDSQRPSPQTTQSEFAVGSARRKKGPRRRIVDVARESSSLNQQSQREISQDIARSTPASVCTDDVSPRSKPTLLPPLQIRSDIPSPQPQPLGTIDSAAFSPPDVSDKGQSLVSEIQNLNLNVNGEAYRQKIESLKSEVGSNWLSVLSEEGWNQHHMKPEVPAFRASSQGILSGSRTLG
ncbi:hypothetical protein HO173_001990 [Letharia columbiana]|uniref:Leucine-rich repeat-containing protein n=1 Tax=Letharia columbiana TaxID=112416 RepID=A0A8H6G4C0_9LECA|nr:uncharacterized protein HO173_001990 [Letharia columbiana]KAF6240379.1 hypothetical protein HO173_001990 [Letharia columbiana]